MRRLGSVHQLVNMNTEWMMRRRPVLFLLALTACAPATVTTNTLPAPPLRPIDAGELRRDLLAFSADSFQGRETGTSGAMRAARFLVDRLVALGVEPAGDSLYYHRVPLIRQTFGPGTRLTVRRGQSTVPLGLGSEVIPLTMLGPGAPPPKRNAEGDVYFAGYGMNPEDFRGVTEPGKVIVIVHSAPPNVADSVARKQLDSQGELQARIIRALNFKPAAIILLTTRGTSEFYQQAAPELMRSMTAAPGDRSSSDSERPFPMIILGVARPDSPLLPAAWPNDDTPQPLTGRHFAGRVDLRLEPFTTYNVVAVVRGSDPRLNKTYVGFGAHYDHIGIQSGMTPDSIANGADDDGSGTVTMLALAKSLMANRPRRSTLFVWHTAEEKGLLGSAYYASHPTVPIDSIVAMLNMDMVGRRGGAVASFDSRVNGATAADRVYIVGPGAAPNGTSKALGAILDSVNARQLQPMQFDREWDSPNHPERIYYRSDHYNYANRGIPVLFFTTGLHEDYHKVSDEAAKVDYPKMARIGGLLLELGTTLANREARPR